MRSFENRESVVYMNGVKSYSKEGISVIPVENE